MLLMIDKLSLTIYRQPDIKYLEAYGDIRVSEARKQIYKYMCVIDEVLVLWKPHKFNEKTNLKIPYVKIDINPKYYCCYEEMESQLKSIFGDHSLSPEEFNVSRVDPAIDIEEFPIIYVLASLRVKRIHSDNFSIYKGTIYAGTNPKIRIYDKVGEIKNRLRKGEHITEYEIKLLKSNKKWTRFEIQVRPEKTSLKSIIDNPVRLSAYFDKLEFYEMFDPESSGFMHFMYTFATNKNRKLLEEYRNNDLVKLIKSKYAESVLEWFDDQEPF